MPSGNWHQSRTSGRQKEGRRRDYERVFGLKSGVRVKPLDISKSNWSKHENKA